MTDIRGPNVLVTCIICLLVQPPFFAYFEKLLSSVAYLVDPVITRLSREPIATWSVVAFQRSSVILSEAVLGYALLR